MAKKTLRAPFAGKLGISTVNPGQYMNPADKLVTLQTIDPIYIDFFLPQQQLPQVAIGQTVTLTTDAYPGVAFPAKINAINSKVDTNTRNVQVEATVPNPKRQLVPGMFANVRVNSGEENRYLTLPQTAITFNPYGEHGVRREGRRTRRKTRMKKAIPSSSRSRCSSRPARRAAIRSRS